MTYWGAVFGFTMGLFDKFGRKRVVDTPITEQTFMGMAVGMASVGLHPVVSLMFVDFLGPGLIRCTTIWLRTTTCRADNSPCR